MRLFLIGGMIVLYLPCFVAAQAWTQMPDFPGTARDDAASFNSYNKIFVGTGRDVGFQYTNDWYAFDTFTETWSPVASLPASGRQYCSGFLLTEMFGFLFGGVDPDGPLNELWRYDVFADTWTQMTSLPAPGRYACTILALGDHAYVCGGLLAGGIPTNEVWQYDQISGSWTAMAPMSGTPRHRAAGMMGHLVIGGADSDYNALSEVYHYDSSTDTWVQMPDLPAPRFGAKTADNFLFCGASSLTDLHDNTFVRSWQNGMWSDMGAPPFPGGPRRGGIASGQTAMADVCLYYFGTGLNGNTRYNDWWKLVCPASIDEIGANKVMAFPNPATDLITPNLPHGWYDAGYRVQDPIGRTITTGLVRSGEPIGISSLSPGRYELLLTHSGNILRTAFIKLP